MGVSNRAAIRQQLLLNAFTVVTLVAQLLPKHFRICQLDTTEAERDDA